MARALCQNEDCEKGEWRLQKAPGAYKNGVRCPGCGTTRVEIDGAGEPDRQQGRAPARQDEGQQQGGAPARQGGGGSIVEDVFAVVDDDVPTRRRAQAASNTIAGFGGIVQKFMEYQDQKQQAAEKRASEVELVETDLPTCRAEMDDGSECGYQFGPEDIGVSNQRVRCPECQSVYDIAGPA